MTKITFYDFCNIGYSSYFLNGLLKLAHERGFQFKVAREAPEALKDIEDEMRTSWFWQLGSRSEYLVFRYEDKEDFLFCIDASDLNGHVSTGGIQTVVLERCKYYFKVNYNAEAMATNPSLAPYTHKIIPLPAFFNVTTPQRWRFLPKFTSIGGPRWPNSIIQRRLRWLVGAQKIEQYRKQRKTKEEIDVYFLTYLYPKAWKPHNAVMNLNRLSVIDGLKRLSRYKILAGYVHYIKQDDRFEQYVDKQYQSKYERYRVPRVSHSTYRNLIAQARIGIYVRGVDGCQSYKICELMAMGKPIVGETFLNNRSRLYAYPCLDEQFAYDEPKDLVSRVEYLLENPDEMRRLGKINGQTFDSELAPKPVMRKVLEQLAA